MQLQMIRAGLLAGFSFLLTVGVLNWLSRPAAAGPAAGDGDISDQVWQVLAEARRILEEESA